MSTRLVPLYALALLSIACGETTGNPQPDSPPGGGVITTENRLTVTGKWTLAPGEERYQCFLIPWQHAGGLNIRRVVPHGGAAIHHLGVFSDESHLEKQASWECSKMGSWSYIFGGGVNASALNMPDGTARQVAEGTNLVLQLHLLNASPSAVDATTSVDLELAPAGMNFQPVGGLMLASLGLRLPPQQRTDTEASCTKHPALQHVFAVFPHMHRLGVGMNITGAADHSRTVIDVQQWDFTEQLTVPIAPELTLEEDLPLQIRCSYNNTTDRTITWGESTNDEMCFAVVYYWPDAGTSQLGVCRG